MIWGKTREEIEAQVGTSEVWFAWYPVRLDDGRWAWFSSIQRDRVWSTDGCTNFPGWAYYEIEREAGR